ncbi:hypothetical protein ASZ90_006669 [hydrocarbon metagenome]|uniref:Uncharacterized protein n=1 Tax=hydrocarbon metagenome TaxID=938273 RepID=A0A0W8FRN8_9ZZZZ
MKKLIQNLFTEPTVQNFAELHKNKNIVIPVPHTREFTPAGIRYYQWFPGYRLFTPANAGCAGMTNRGVVQDSTWVMLKWCNLSIHR